MLSQDDKERPIGTAFFVVKNLKKEFFAQNYHR